MFLLQLLFCLLVSQCTGSDHMCVKESSLNLATVHLVPYSLQNIFKNKQLLNFFSLEKYKILLCYELEKEIEVWKKILALKETPNKIM